MVSIYDIYGFIHANEQVYFPLLNLIWRDEDLYVNVIPVLGGFHQVSVIQKKYYANATSAWGTKAGLLIQRLLHQDRRIKVLKDDITSLQKEVSAGIVQTKAESLAINIVPLLLSKVSNDRKVFEGCVNNAG